MVLAAVMISGSCLSAGCGKNGGQEEELSSKEILRRQELEVIPEDAIYKDASYSVEERVADLMSYMTIEEKASQMVMAERNVSAGGISSSDLKKHPLGSVLSGGGSSPATGNSSKAWADMINKYQKAAVEDTRLGIPILYGVDAVHGNSNVYGVTIFPHNVGLGATGDLELVEQIGAYTARDVRATGANWSFAPTLGNPQNVTWGRSYECFSEDASVVAEFGAAYIRGLQGELSGDEFLSTSKTIATAKHYIGEGYTKNGVNQGDVDMSAEEFDALLENGVLEPYKKAVESGVKAVMVSYNSVDGIKCHGNKHLINDILRGQLGFDGIVVGDYNGIQQIETENNTFDEQLLAAIDAGIDVTMEPFLWREIVDYIVEFVEEGKVTEERINQSVERILTVKFELGLFENPYANEEYLELTGSEESREIARQAVRESLVLLKNDVQENGSTIMESLKDYSNIFVAGSGADDMGTQCGGWTISWQGQTGDCTEGTTILEGIEAAAGSRTITYSEDGSGMPEDAEAAIVVLSESPYAEMYGDTGYSDLTFDEEEWAVVDRIREQSPDIPVIAVLVTGRTLTITDYIDEFDGIVCAWLPGSEGEGIADVLFGDYDFTGKLAYTWYWYGEDIKTNGSDESRILFTNGYGLTKSETAQLPEAPEPLPVSGTLEFDIEPEERNLIKFSENGGKIEAENYYYAEGCDIEFGQDISSEMVLINIKSEAIMAYYIDVAESAGYDAIWRVAAPSDIEDAVSVYIDGKLVDTVSFTATGSYYTYDLQHKDMLLDAGKHIVVLSVNNDGFNLNRVSFVRAGEE